MTWCHQVEFPRQLARLYMGRHESVWRALGVSLVGASGMFVDVTGYLVLQWIGLEHGLARLPSLWPAVTWNWFLNRDVTFGARPPQLQVRQWVRFVCTNLGGLGANLGTYTLLTTWIEFFDRHRFISPHAESALGAPSVSWPRHLSSITSTRRRTPVCGLEPVSDRGLRSAQNRPSRPACNYTVESTPWQ